MFVKTFYLAFNQLRYWRSKTLYFMTLCKNINPAIFAARKMTYV